MSPTSNNPKRDEHQGGSDFPSPRIRDLFGASAPVTPLRSVLAGAGGTAPPIIPPDGLDPASRDSAERLKARVIKHGEDLVRGVVAVVLIGVATLTLFDTILALGHAVVHFSAATAATYAVNGAVNGVLFAIVMFELTDTVLARFNSTTLQLQTFLTIGIVSAVREVLTVGARLSLQPNVAVHNALMELGINAAVVFGLAVSLVLIRRFGSTAGDDGAAVAAAR